MTEYITVTAKKRNFTIPAQMPELSDTAVTVTLSDQVYIARNGDTYIARNGDRYMAHGGTTSAYPRSVKAKKRNFVVVAKVKNE